MGCRLVGKLVLVWIMDSSWLYVFWIVLARPSLRIAASHTQSLNWMPCSQYHTERVFVSMLAVYPKSFQVKDPHFCLLSQYKMAWKELNLPSCPLFYSPLYVLVIFPMALSVAQPRPLWYQLQLFSNIRQPIIIPSLMSHCVANRASSKTIIVPLEYNAKKQKKCKEFVVIECTEGWVLCTY